MLIRLSAITPRPTQRFMPASSLYRDRLSPCLLLSRLILPSQPVRHFCPFLNQRFFCVSRRASLLVERFGIETRFTPFSCAAASFFAEKNPLHIPRFDDFPAAENWDHQPGSLKLTTASERMFRTNLRNAAKEAPNFAGHYR